MADKKGKLPVKAANPAPAKVEKKHVSSASASAPPKTASNPDAPKGTTATVKKITKPDDAKFKKDLATIDDKILKLENRKKELQDRILSADGKSPVGGGKRKELLEERQRIFAEVRAARDERDKLFKKYDEIKKVRDAKLKEAEEIRDRAGTHKHIEKIDQTITELEEKNQSSKFENLGRKKNRH